MYEKNYQKPQEQIEKPKHFYMSHKNMSDVIEKIIKEEFYLPTRVSKLDQLVFKVSPGSRPYIEYLSKKYSTKHDGCWSTHYGTYKCNDKTHHQDCPSINVTQQSTVHDPQDQFGDRSW
jgi:hypothetical protein